MRKLALMIVFIIGATLAGCGKRSQIVVAIKGYHLSFPLPAGWTITQNDNMLPYGGTAAKNDDRDKGALCVLIKRDAPPGFGPTICIWLGNYAQKLGESLFGGEAPLNVMLFMAVSGADVLRGASPPDKIEFHMDLNMNIKTEHPCGAFTTPGSDVIATFAVPSYKSSTHFAITAAATKESLDETTSVADRLITHILDQLKASPRNLERELAERISQPEQESPVRISGSIADPKVIRRIEPVYPPAALAAGVQGSVIIELETDISGKVRDTKFISGHELLRDAAISAVKHWVFEPLIINGKSRSAIFSVKIPFELPKK